MGLGHGDLVSHRKIFPWFGIIGNVFRARFKEENKGIKKKESLAMALAYVGGMRIDGRLKKRYKQTKLVLMVFYGEKRFFLCLDTNFASAFSHLVQSGGGRSFDSKPFLISMLEQKRYSLRFLLYY